jgi:hypothetical protein
MDKPAGLGGAGFGLDAYAKQDDGNFFLRGGQNKAAAGGKIESLERPYCFDHQRADMATGEHVARCAKHVSSVWHTQQKNALWIEPEVEKSVGIRRGEFLRRKFRSYPAEIPVAA